MTRSLFQQLGKGQDITHYFFMPLASSSFLLQHQPTSKEKNEKVMAFIINIYFLVP